LVDDFEKGIAMTLSVEIEAKPEYLLSKVTGQFDMNEAMEVFPEVILACRRYELNKVLADIRALEGETAMVEEIMYAMGIGKLHSQHLEIGGAPLKIAYVGNESFIRSFNPGPDVAEKYGLEVFLTTNLNQAIEWLSS
jgi:hypothetical protein